MSVPNNPKRNSTDDLEMEGLRDKRTRFQVNRVKNESPEKNVDAVLTLPDEDDDEDIDNHLLSVTDRTRLNSESDTKYAKSFR